jgi:hypothetical protein
MINRSGYNCEKSDYYLGDGVYVKWDDNLPQVWLMTQSGDAIALDYQMVGRLAQIMGFKND